jgi:predicted RNase H-like nuclease (RuvC/YqgF family)
MVEELKNVEKISSIINDIEHEFETQKNEIEASISIIKNNIKMEKFEFENTKIKLNKKYTNLKETYNRLLDEKNHNIKCIDNDQSDLQKIEEENVELRGQIEKQEIINDEIKKTLENKRMVVIDLKRKIDNITRINQNKESRLVGKVLECKKFLGVNFQVVEGNKIKVIFDKLCRDESFECYVVLDLNDGYNIVDVYPKVSSIERYSIGLKDKTNFFELIQAIRKEFAKEYCK